MLRFPSFYIGPLGLRRQSKLANILDQSFVVHFSYFFINVRHHEGKKPGHQISTYSNSFVCHEMGHLAGYRLDCMCGSPRWRKFLDNAGSLDKKIPGNTTLPHSVGKQASVDTCTLPSYAVEKRAILEAF